MILLRDTIFIHFLWFSCFQDLYLCVFSIDFLLKLISYIAELCNLVSQRNLFLTRLLSHKLRHFHLRIILSCSYKYLAFQHLSKPYAFFHQYLTILFSFFQSRASNISSQEFIFSIFGF